VSPVQMHAFTPRPFGACGPGNAGGRGTDDSLRRGETAVGLRCGVSAFLGVFAGTEFHARSVQRRKIVAKITRYNRAR
jgi:hypothetical protein